MKAKLKATAIILAGGCGRRFGGARPKQLARLAGRPLLGYTLEAFEESPNVEGIVLVAPEGYLDAHRRIAKKFAPRKTRAIVAGGQTRQASSLAGVEAASWAELVLIHDAARPFVTNPIIRASIEAAQRSGASVAAVQSVDTILTASRGFVRDILKRDGLMNMQTPQGFRRPIILEAHRRALADGLSDATDDVGLVLRLAGKVEVVAGSYENIKITTAADLVSAKCILERRQKAGV